MGRQFVQVPDLQATLDQAVAKGATVLMPPTEIPGTVTLAMFADPEGNMMGLTKEPTA
jgi:predicted enzyme related to lactoylglutathione lyase